MVRVEVFTKAGILILADMEAAHVATLLIRWSEARGSNDGIVALSATVDGAEMASNVLLSEIAVIRSTLTGGD